jgi:hypothetical protein
MTTTRAQLDAAEAWLLEEWRINFDTSHRITSGKNAKRQWATDELAARRDTRAKLATAIRAIRAQRPNCIKCDERPQTLDSGQYCFACLARDRAEYAAWDASLRESEVRP